MDSAKRIELIVDGKNVKTDGLSSADELDGATRAVFGLLLAMFESAVEEMAKKAGVSLSEAFQNKGQLDDAMVRYIATITAGLVESAKDYADEMWARIKNPSDVGHQA